MSVGPEKTAEELAYHRDWTIFQADEFRDCWRLQHPSSHLYSAEGDNCPSKRHGQNHGPLPIIVSASRRPHACQKLNVFQHSLPINRLARVHPSLAMDTNRTIVQDMTKQSGERECTGSVVFSFKSESQVTCPQDIS